MTSTWDRIKARSVTQGDGCWLWTGCRTPGGYGQISHGGKMLSVHREAWAATNGPIPDDRVIDHACHRRHCVNPDHLRLATPQENNRNRLGRQGLRGVSKHRNGWRARYYVNRRAVNLGTFSTPEEAGRVAREARAQAFGQFAGPS